MENKYRNVYCGEVTKEYVNKEVRLAGWIDTIRYLGSLLFITLRDEKGIVQLISNDVEKYKDLNRESTVTVTGIVRKRTDDMINKNMKTGEIEVEIEKESIKKKKHTKIAIIVSRLFVRFSCIAFYEHVPSPISFAFTFGKYGA